MDHQDHFDTLFPIAPQWLEPVLEELGDEAPELLYVDETEFLGFI